MKINQVRNATLVIETGKEFLLVDPMMGKKGKVSLPFSLFRFKPRMNPIVDLPPNAERLFERATHCLITHLHPDHLDKKAIAFLRKKQIPVTCSVKDEKTLRGYELNIVQTIDFGKESKFIGGKIIGIPAKHGYGFVSKLMGNVMGFYIELPGEKSLYLSSDTIYTEEVHRVLTKLKPAISIIPAGSAQLDLFKPILMDIKDLLKFIENAPGKVIANHLEALNHCPMTRGKLWNEAKKAGLENKLLIPEDGKHYTF